MVPTESLTITSHVQVRAKDVKFVSLFLLIVGRNSDHHLQKIRDYLPKILGEHLIAPFSFFSKH